MSKKKFLHVGFMLFVAISVFGMNETALCASSHTFKEYENLNDDNDHRHITFVNQTSHEVKFKIDGLGDRAVEPYTAELQNCNPDKKVKFTVDLVKLGRDKEIHSKYTGKCGKTYYLYTKRKKYLISGITSKDLISPDLDDDAPPYVYKSNSFDVEKFNSCQPYDANTKTILFAHGLNDSPRVWNTFAAEAHKNKWRVLRTIVTKNASIKKRARMLNAYIMRVDKKCKIPDGSLRVVGHSMGGLDLRYIIHYGLPAAKKIEQVYTLATPHQGDNLANFGSGDAIDNLKPEFMRKFNYWNPYCDQQMVLSKHKRNSHRFSVDGRQIYLYAYRFNCDGDNNSGDGVVGWRKQRYGRHYTSRNSLNKGKHMAKIQTTACRAEVETEQVTILKKILDANTQTETCDSTVGDMPE